MKILFYSLSLLANLILIIAWGNSMLTVVSQISRILPYIITKYSLIWWVWQCCLPRITPTSKTNIYSSFRHHSTDSSLKRLICQNLSFLGSEWKSNIFLKVGNIPAVPSLQCGGRTGVKFFRISPKNDHKLLG